MKATKARVARSLLSAALTLASTGVSAQAVRSIPVGPEAPAVAAAPATPPARAPRESVMVMIDHAKVIRLPEKTLTVVVGNPIIADITAQRNGVLVVTGKSYGVTNLIALDAGGAMLAESMISVQAPNDTVVTVQRGLDRETYSCTPNCQPSLLLGDSKKHFDEVGGQTGTRNTLATGR